MFRVPPSIILGYWAAELQCYILEYHICLSILQDDWSPALMSMQVAHSILSMLSSNTVLEPPEDNARYTARVPHTASPKKTRFAFHDDKV